MDKVLFYYNRFLCQRYFISCAMVIVVLQDDETSQQ